MPGASDFHTKTYIVTGGASGLGLSVVKKLLSLSGAHVHVIDLSEKSPELGSDTHLYFHGGVNMAPATALREELGSCSYTTSKQACGDWHDEELGEGVRAARDAGHPGYTWCPLDWPDGRFFGALIGS